MYSQRFGIVPREFKGPTPKAVIIVSNRIFVRGNLRPFPSPGEAWPVLSPGKQVPEAAGFGEEKVVAHCPHPPHPFPLQPPTTITTWDLGVFVFPLVSPKCRELGCGSIMEGHWAKRLILDLNWLWFNGTTLGWSCDPMKTVYRKGIGLWMLCVIAGCSCAG